MNKIPATTQPVLLRRLLVALSASAGLMASTVHANAEGGSGARALEASPGAAPAIVSVGEKPLAATLEISVADTNPAVSRHEKAAYLFVLGVTQDAGYPQAGCYAPHCLPGWQTPGGQRGAVSLGLITSTRKYLFEATPSLPSQLYALEQEAPTDTHPLSGVFLTHAHIGHYAGLMFFGHEAMSTSRLPVYVMPRMERFLRNNGPWSQLVDFENIELRPLRSDTAVHIDGVSVTPFVVPHRDEYSETVGFRIAGASRSAVFIPDINKWADWSQDLRDVIRTVDYALIDAAFFADGELPGRDMSKIPHPFVSETMALLDSMALADRNKVWFIHMNHTNPLLRADSEQSRRVEEAGYHIAREGIRLHLP